MEKKIKILIWRNARKDWSTEQAACFAHAYTKESLMFSKDILREAPVFSQIFFNSKYPSIFWELNRGFSRNMLSLFKKYEEVSFLPFSWLSGYSWFSPQQDLQHQQTPAPQILYKSYGCANSIFNSFFIRKLQIFFSQQEFNTKHAFFFSPLSMRTEKIQMYIMP